MAASRPALTATVMMVVVVTSVAEKTASEDGVDDADDAMTGVVDGAPALHASPSLDALHARGSQ
jgi:hypothetical protein